MVTEAIVVLIAIAAATVGNVYLNHQAIANLGGIVATITTQVGAYKKSVAAHLDILEATGSEEIKKVVADVRAKLVAAEGKL
jgi:hypothetical protein